MGENQPKKRIYTLHGHNRKGKRSPTYSSWSAMINRATNPNDPSYEKYGGNGVVVCDRWKVFKNFLEDMGERPKGTSLERIDNEGIYCPENCKWATRKEQQRNLSTNRLITHDGQSKCLSEWSEAVGIHHNTIAGRLKSGWSVKDALTVKPLKGNKSRKT